ncbi:AraC family transcriptional regulator [Asaia siamensis]|uniref:AraC family transcriptional regulator n=1 Tax=Asaia siamensis TaxID=110479 RepID=A0ABQ1L6U3_9PROT|nr:AraC family transcriptional regulator [Asaia siamensis]GBR09504.1 AraC family transcriptional regulator [Asaia siamensis NRIC 0323]GGC19885.1 AraC family transcriptional regulator [Asaia siamensis]
MVATRADRNDRRRGGRIPAILELFPDQKVESFRWHRHDYPAPIACWNYHPEYELHLITHGAGRVMIGDHIGPFEARQLVLVGPDLPHAWFSPLGEGEVMAGRDVVLQFSQSWIDGLIGLCPELAGLSQMLAESRHGLEFSGEQALRCGARLEELGERTGGARLAGAIALLADLTRCSWRRLATRHDPETPETTKGGQIARLVRQLLAADPAEIRHERIAASLGMTASTFSRQFRALTGESFMGFLQRLRIGHACHLLTTTPLAVTDICRASGFGNLSNFNRAFLSLRGCTPRQFRQQARQIAMAETRAAVVPSEGLVLS